MIDFVPDQRLYPFRSRWFDSSAGRLHYLDEGEGPALLLCHGSPTWSFLFRHLVTGLRDRYRCVAVDLLGFGLSERPADFGYTVAEHAGVLGEVVDGLELDGFLVLGHDWGGPTGLGAATTRADRVAGVILANTAFWPIVQWPNRAFSVIMSSPPMRRRILDDNVLVERFLLGRAGPALSQAEADHYRAVQPTREARRALAVMPREIRAARPLLERLARDVPENLGHVPALAVWGMRDPVFRPKACLPRLYAAFTEIEVVEVAQAGHFVPEDAPSQVVEAIVERFG
jgi:haloalkane dehalogenase